MSDNFKCKNCWFVLLSKWAKVKFVQFANLQPNLFAPAAKRFVIVPGAELWKLQNTSVESQSSQSLSSFREHQKSHWKVHKKICATLKKWFSISESEQYGRQEKINIQTVQAKLNIHARLSINLQRNIHSILSNTFHGLLKSIEIHSRNSVNVFSDTWRPTTISRRERKF